MKQYISLCFALVFFTIAEAQNLALSGTATSSSNELQAASNAIDGNGGTRWESQFSDPQWISIDLGTSYEIGKVVLNWEGAYASSYEIQVSDDPTFDSFTTAFSTTTGDGGVDEISLNETGRYVRMYGTVRGTIYGYSLWEFEVYEALDPVTVGTLSDLTVNGTTVAGFTSSKLDYTILLPLGTVDVPTVVATPTQSIASVSLNNAPALPGATTVLVTSQDGLESNTYTINFKVEIVPVNQTFDLTFESGTAGSNAAAWNVFENDTNPPFEIVDNPDPSGINTSAKVGKLTTLINGAFFAGCETQHGSIWEWVLDETTTTITIDVYKSVISNVGIKMVNVTSGTIFEFIQPNTVTDEWETLTYDISIAVSSGENYNIDQIVVFPDWESPRVTDNVNYFDNISWEGLKLLDAITVSGNTENEFPKIGVYPNPSQDFWNITSSEQVLNSVILFDAFGKQVLEIQPTSPSVQINASSLNAGLYFALLKTDAGFKTVKLIKM